MKSRTLSRASGLGIAAGWLLLGMFQDALARPGAGAASLPVIRAMNLRGEGSDLAAGPGVGVFAAALGETTWFGGTVWAADSMRWEAIPGGVWTFDSGVGSSMVPPGGPGGLSSPTREWVNPYKQPGLHATLEGWIGFDNTYSDIAYFRRLSSTDPRWGSDVCVGEAAGLGGNYSYWCGLLQSEAEELCYPGGQGYGNSWKVCIEHPFTYSGGPVTLAFAFRIETEVNFDFSTVYVDTSGNGTDVEVVSYTGVVDYQANLPLSQGIELPVVVPASIKIKFCFTSEGAWSDQDGLFPTSCGSFALDDVSVSGGGIAHTADFETSDDGWVLSPGPGPGGEWANLVHLADLPPMMAACPCNLADTVLVFFDDSNGHGLDTNNLAASPWIDLKAEGRDGSPGKILKTNIYAHLPLQNYLFIQFYAQWYPETCLSTGKLVMSPWISDGFSYFFGQTPECSTGYPLLGTELDYSAIIPSGAEQVRMAMGVKSLCRFFTQCTQLSNSTPWFDEATFGVYGAPGAPFIATDPIDLTQDNFPENGTLNLNAPGRVDSNRIQGASQPEIGTSLGDTLVVRGASGNAEVHVHFRVDPGPGVSPVRLVDWWNRHADSPYENGFKTARCDTAEVGGSIKQGRWMTAYHEADPNFVGTDEDLDADDMGPQGGMWRLRNDIFPDDLFTAGTRLDLFYTSNAPGNSEYYRIPAAPQTYEMEVFPSSATVNTQWNCVLYVDHFGGGAQALIEPALAGFLGMSSENFEHTNWDRFDVNAASSRQMSFGRPLGTEYGASVVQALGYKVILWNSGDLNAGNLTKEDADVLNPWLTLLDFDFNSLYLSGDGIVFSPTFEAESEPSARRLIEELAGVGLRTECSQGTYRLANCPTYGVPMDLTPCVGLQPVVNALVAGSGDGREVIHVAQGNGCPDLRSFDVLEVLTPDFGGVNRGDERYESPLKAARFASVATNAAPGDILNYKIVVDGVSVHYRRDEGTPCSYGQGGTSAIAERLVEVLTFFGFPNSALCHDVTGLVEEIPETPALVPALTGISPNPLQAGSPGLIRFTLPREGRVVVGVYDLQGRRVKTIFDGVATAGVNEVVWSGTDEAGTAVGSGVYFYRFRAFDRDESRRVVVIGR